MGATDRCVYCATGPRVQPAQRAQHSARAPRVASQQAPQRCVNCSQLAPASATQGAGFRCLHCGAVNHEQDGRQEHPSEPRAMPSDRPPRTPQARRLTIDQQRALRSGLDTLAFPLLALVMLSVCGAVAYLFVPLRELNPGPRLLLMLAPLAGFLLSAAIGLLRNGIARRALEKLCAAIAPKAEGAPARCYTCGKPLPVRTYIERCSGCGSDNVTAKGAMRRAAKSDASLATDADRPVLDEIALLADGLERTRSFTRISTMLLPLAALAVLGVSSWREQWRLPPMSRRRHVVISAPDCNMVVTATGGLGNGFVATDVNLRGAWVKDMLPLVYVRTFTADEFLHRVVVFPSTGARGEISAVFRTPINPQVRLQVDVKGKPLEMPLIRACIEERDPYRDATGQTKAQRQSTIAEHERLVQQGQLHEQPVENAAATGKAGAKAKAMGANANANTAQSPRARSQAETAVDPSLQMWTRPH